MTATTISMPLPSILDYIDNGSPNSFEATDNGSGWPRKVWVVQFSNGQYGVLKLSKDGRAIHGLACFKRKGSIDKYLPLVKNKGLMGHKSVQVSFEEARRIAIERGGEITALILYDNRDPLIYYVN